MYTLRIPLCVNVYRQCSKQWRIKDFLRGGVKNCSEGRHVIAQFKDKFASSFNDSTSRPLFEIMLFLVYQWYQLPTGITFKVMKYSGTKIFCSHSSSSSGSLQGLIRQMYSTVGHRNSSRCYFFSFSFP